MILYKFVFYIKLHFELCDLGFWPRVELFKGADNNNEECFRHFTRCSTLALTNGNTSWWDNDSLRLPNLLGGGEKRAVGSVGEPMEIKEWTVSWASWWAVSCSRKEPDTAVRRKWSNSLKKRWSTVLIGGSSRTQRLSNSSYSLILQISPRSGSPTDGPVRETSSGIISIRSGAWADETEYRRGCNGMERIASTTGRGSRSSLYLSWLLSVSAQSMWHRIYLLRIP